MIPVDVDCVRCMHARIHHPHFIQHPLIGFVQFSDWCLGFIERQRQSEIVKERDRDRKWDRDRQTDRVCERERESQTDIQSVRERESQTDRDSERDTQTQIPQCLEC